MNWLATITAVLGIIPSIIQVLMAIEVAIPDGGKGEEKLKAVREIVEVSHSEAVTLWPVLERAITVLVNLFNATGAFKKSG